MIENRGTRAGRWPRSCAAGRLPEEQSGGFSPSPGPHWVTAVLTRVTCPAMGLLCISLMTVTVGTLSCVCVASCRVGESTASWFSVFGSRHPLRPQGSQCGPWERQLAGTWAELQADAEPHEHPVCSLLPQPGEAEAPMGRASLPQQVRAVLGRAISLAESVLHCGADCGWRPWVHFSLVSPTVMGSEGWPSGVVASSSC